MNANVHVTAPCLLPCVCGTIVSCSRVPWYCCLKPVKAWCSSAIYCCMGSWRWLCECSSTAIVSPRKPAVKWLCWLLLLFSWTTSSLSCQLFWQ
jgi:hypothetical protein